MIYLMGGWLVLSGLTFALLRPLMNISSRDQRQRPQGIMPRLAGTVSSPQAAGYSGVVLERLTHHARTVLGFEHAWIAIGAPGGRSAVVAAATDPDLVGLRVRPGHAAGQLDAAVSATATTAHGAACTLGLGVAGDRPELEPYETELLWEIAGLAAETVRHHDRRALMLGDSAAEIRALVQALAEAEGETYDAAVATAATARLVGERLFLDRADLVEVELGALLRDVGKLRLPQSLLQSPGPLRDDDRQLMRLHPVWSAEMIARIPGMEAVALIVRLHHERPDGVGYPHELHLERIPMASRILAVCDAFAAVTRPRGYSEPVPVDEAIEELELHAGTQFDATVVDALASVVSDRAATAREPRAGSGFESRRGDSNP